MSKPQIKFEYHTYPGITHPNGWLPRDKRAQACWFFYLSAQATKEIVGTGTESQIILEGDLWMDPRYEQIARTVALIYGIDSPDEMFKFWPYVIKQAAELGLPIPSEEYMRPLRIVRPT